MAPATPSTPAGPTINPDADPVLPQLATGWVDRKSNYYGIQGAWYCFDDGVQPTSCVQDEPPFVDGSGMCLSGSTVVDSTYAAWGAGIGLTLNDESSKKLAYDADTAGITGFKFTITGSLGGATLNIVMPLTSKDSEDRPPEFAVKVGANSVPFTSLERPTYKDTDATGSPDPTALYEVKWQIKGGDLAADYDFCVTNVEPY